MGLGKARQNGSKLIVGVGEKTFNVITRSLLSACHVLHKLVLYRDGQG